MSTELSIIIPTYNRNGSISQCLEHLNYPDADVIVVDDGSLVRVECPDHVRLVRHGSNRGRAATVNTGLHKALHETVLILDDDIYATPSMVEELALHKALHETVLILDDDIYATPSMVEELAFAFRKWKNRKGAIVGRVVWDPELGRTLTMDWLEKHGPFRDLAGDQPQPLANLSTGNTILWKPLVLENGGFDEGFTHYGLEDVELGLRLKRKGFEVRLHPLAVGYHHKSMEVLDLIHRELEEGKSAVYLHSSFPNHTPELGDIDAILRNEKLTDSISRTVERLEILESDPTSTLDDDTAQAFSDVYRHYFLKGAQEELQKISSIRQAPGRSNSPLALYDTASTLERSGQLREARELFRRVLFARNHEYLAGAQFHLGSIELALGNDRAARRHFADCIRIDPDFKKAVEKLQLSFPPDKTRPTLPLGTGDAPRKNCSVS